MSAKSVKESLCLESLVSESPSPAVLRVQISGRVDHLVQNGLHRKPEKLICPFNFGNVSGYLERVLSLCS